MTIDQLSYFVAAVQHNTFLEAAEVNHISQSSLSKSLQRLEEDLKVQLFDRTKRSAILTKEGEIFYKGALKILDAYNETMLDLQESVLNFQNTIRIITLPILSAYDLTTPLRLFTTQNKGIKLIIEEMEDTQIQYEIENEICDLAITRKECLNDICCTDYSVDTDELILLTSPNHPLATRESVSIEELSKEVFILMNKYTGIYRLCLEACRKYNFMPDVIRTARIESIISAVEANEGISLLMRKDLNMFNHNSVCLVPLKEEITSTVVLALNKNKKITPQVKSLITYLTTSKRNI